jgi:hypothetical protein
MNKDDIIRMAREAECSETWGGDAFKFTVDELERFAALVAKAEREACAKVCDEWGYVNLPGVDPAKRCAKDIRSRGNT